MMLQESFPSPYIVGPPIKDPEDFLGRGRQVKRFFNMLRGRTLASLRILGLRRSGKTSFLLHVSNRTVIERELGKAAPSVVVAFVNLQENILSQDDFYLVAADATCEALIKAGYTPPEKKPADQGFRPFLKWLKTILTANTNVRLVLLLDEFEVLANSTVFTKDFFGNLRSIVTAHTRFAWVTASYRDLWSLEPKFTDSEFSNIFHPTPIVLGAMDDEESKQVICKPAAAERVKITDAGVTAIRELAGPLPYFLQAAAEQWFFARKDGAEDKGLGKEKLIELLWAPNCLIQETYKLYWRQMSEDNRKYLFKVAEQKSIPMVGKSNEDILFQYGLLWKESGYITIAGELFQKWIIERSPAMQPSDIAPYVPVIVEATKFVFEEAGKWMDDIRKKASKPKTDKTPPASLAYSITPEQFSKMQADLEGMAGLMDHLKAKMAAVEIESLVVQIQIHRKNLNRLETKKVKYGLAVPNQVENEIEDEANAIIEKMERLENLLGTVYYPKA